VTSKIIFDDVTVKDKLMISKEEFVDTIKNRNFEILLTVGAGNLNLEVPRLCQYIQQQTL
jgi:UDP-N-acetylmuramate--alanine ligase